MKNSEKLRKITHGAYTILCKPDAKKELELFKKSLAILEKIDKIGEAFPLGDVPADGQITLFYSGRCKLWKIEAGGKKYILKLDKRDTHRFDYLVQSFFCGSNAFRLMRTLHRAFLAGFRGSPEMFLVADKRAFGCTLCSFFFYEFINGENLRYVPEEIWRKYAPEAAEILYTLHKFGCTHGDAKRENFVLDSDDGKLKAIDIGGKSPNAKQRAIDRLWLRDQWGIPNTTKDFGYFLVTLHEKWRDFTQQLKK